MTLEEAISYLGLRQGPAYTIPTGGARSNEWFNRPSTYLSKLGAQREENPPVGWDDQPAKLGINPDMLNDPAFSQYDLSQLRTFKQDPRLRDEIDLGIVGTKGGRQFAKSPGLHKAYGFTYVPDRTPYDPNKVYMRDYGELGLDKLKMATGPGAEQIKQGNINKEIASTIAHEFRHNIFDKPEYSDILDKVYDRFEGTISRGKIEEYVNRAADAELIPGDWDWAKFDIPKTLQQHQKEYNLKQRKMYGYPAHLTQINTTKQFNQAAKEFFKRARREKLKKQQLQNFKNIEAAEAKKITTGGPPSITQKPKPKWTPPQQTGGDGGIHGGGGRPRPDKPGGFTDPGKGSYGPWKADGGLINFYKYGGFI